MTKTRITLCVAALVAIALLVTEIARRVGETEDSGPAGSRESVARTIDGGALALDPTTPKCRVEIQVSIAGDGEDRPAGGAWVRADPRTDDEYFHPAGPPYAEAVTDAAGRAELMLPDGREWQIAVGRADLGPRAQVWRVADTALEFVLDAVTPVECCVHDADGEPVRDAEIFLMGGLSIPVARSNAEGLFKLAIDEDCFYMIRHRACAAIGVHGDALLISPRIVLRPRFTLSGVVLDRQGLPVEGAMVRMDGEYGALERRSARDGQFEFADLWAYPDLGREELDLEIAMEGFLPAEISAIPGDRAIRVTLERAGAISGQVVLPDGSPAEGARVGIWPLRGGGREWVEVGAAGAFRFEQVRPGPVVLMSGWGRAHPSVSAGVRRSTHSARLVVEVAPNGLLEDVTLVLAPDVPPVSFLRVRCLDTDGSSLPRGEHAQVSPLHCWHLTPMVAGEVTASIVRPAHTPVRTAISFGVYRSDPRGVRAFRRLSTIRRTILTTSSPEDPPVEVRRPRPSHLTVRVRTADGRRLESQATVSVVRSALGSAIEGDNLGWGECRFAVPPGAVILIEVDALGYGPVLRLLAMAEDPVDIEIQLRAAARVSGRLIVPDAARLPSLFVHDEKDQWAREVLPEPNGCFELTEVPAGRLIAAIEHNNCEMVLRDFDVEPGDDINLGEIRVDALPRVTGRVTDDSGRPVAALVALFARSGRKRIVSQATGSEGCFDLRIVALPDGWIEVRARGLGRAFILATASLKSPLAVRLKPEGRLRIALEPDVSLRATPDWTATIPGGSVVWDPPAKAVFDPGGRLCFELGELPDGNVRIRCRARDRIGRRLVGETDVRVVAGQVHTATITLRPE
jgi:hypothetical protein